MTVAKNQQRKESPQNQSITMDPKQMFPPVYGTTNKVAVPIICMNASTTNCPIKKTPEDPFKRFIRNYFPFFAGLSTFAMVLFLLTICMDESRKKTKNNSREMYE